jgi:hypothetical protein
MAGNPLPLQGKEPPASLKNLKKQQVSKIAPAAYTGPKPAHFEPKTKIGNNVKHSI